MHCVSSARWLGAVGILGLGLALGGCSTQNQVGNSVSGTVRYKGQPLPGGLVFFHDGENPQQQVSSAIGQDGGYQITNLTPGVKKITVQGPQGGDYGTVKIPKVDLPKQYSDPQASGLTYTVTEGKQTHDVEVK